MYVIEVNEMGMQQYYHTQSQCTASVPYHLHVVHRSQNHDRRINLQPSALGTMHRCPPAMDNTYKARIPIRSILYRWNRWTTSAMAHSYKKTYLNTSIIMSSIDIDVVQWLILELHCRSQRIVSNNLKSARKFGHLPSDPYSDHILPHASTCHFIIA